MNNMNISYIRVSTVEQNEVRQVEAMKSYKIDKTYTEKLSAKDTDRPKFQEMIEFARDGDKIYVHDFSRLARSTKDLLNIVEQLEAKKVKLISLKENLDTSTATGKLMLTMIGAINEFERANMLERQREGIAEAKKDGKYKGRKEVEVTGFEAHYERYMKRAVSKSALARELNISRPTLDRLIGEQQKKFM
jgi:DNA invertase Pin-like site-specific DNA recombinase